MARPSTKLRAVELAAAQPRAMVRDHSARSGRLDLRFDPRTAYDFVVSLTVLPAEEAELLPADAAWFERVRQGVPPEQHDLIGQCFGDDPFKFSGGIAAVVVDNLEITDAASLARAVETMADHELGRYALRDVLGHSGAAQWTEPVLAGDADARRRVDELLDERERAAVDAFLADMDANIDRVRAAIRAWLPLYQEIEPRVAAMVERDVRARRSQRGAADIVALIEDATGGLRWLPEPGARRVIMAPTYFGRPYNHIFQGSDWRLFVYPLAEEALGATDPSVPPPAAVRLYRALGDATRMRVLRLLSQRDWYLTELAQQLELSKPTMKHHLALLRAAGLVTVTEEGSMTYYTLRRERLREAGLELQRYLG